MDSFREEKIRIANEQIEGLIEAGTPIAKLNIFDILDNYVPSDKIKNQVDYTTELYLELIDTLNECDEDTQRVFLNTLKDADVIDNQSMEKEDTFLIILNRNLDKISSIDLLLKKYCHDKHISYDNFIDIHDNLLRGTSSEGKLGLRDNNLKFVGSYQTDPKTKFYFENRAISYFPLRYTEIDIAINKLLNFINSGIKPNDKYDAILIPIACHGLIASLQLFKDGNTRYGRLIQNVLIYKLMNDEFNLNLSLPLVYPTRQYVPYRDDYRRIIENIVVNNNNAAWEEWFYFNLKRIQENIYYNTGCLNTLKVKHKTR